MRRHHLKMTHLCICFAKNVFFCPNTWICIQNDHSLFLYSFFICSTHRRPIFRLFFGPVQIHIRQKIALFHATKLPNLLHVEQHPYVNWSKMMSATLLFNCHCHPPSPPPIATTATITVIVVIVIVAVAIAVTVAIAAAAFS